METAELERLLREIRSDVKQYRYIVEDLHKNFRGRAFKLLEVGAGSCLIKPFVPDNISYHSLDFDESHTFSFNLDDGKFPINDCQYDIIICTETLEHVMYPHNVMSEMLRVAKDDAVFFISQPNEYNFLQRVYYLLAKKPPLTDEPYLLVEKHQHIHRPRVKDAISLVSKYLKIKRFWFIWQSRQSGHGKLKFVAKFVDSIIIFLARIYPSMFCRLVLMRGVKK